MKKIISAAVVMAVAFSACCFADGVKLPKKDNVKIQIIDPTKTPKTEEQQDTKKDTKKKATETQPSNDTEDDYYGYDPYSTFDYTDDDTTDGSYGYDPYATDDDTTGGSYGYDPYSTFDDDESGSYDLPEEYLYDPRYSAGYSMSYAMKFSEKNLSEQERELLNLIKDFRNGSDAYYKSSSGKNISKVGKLKSLKLSLDLCTIAKWRAWETSKSYSYTRPDGNPYYTALDDIGIEYSDCGECIVAGTNSAKEAFASWLEANNDYDSQYHRRTLLGNYTYIGVSFLELKDAPYKYYWCIVLINE